MLNFVLNFCDVYSYDLCFTCFMYYEYVHYEAK